MPTHSSVKDAAWQRYEAAYAALLYLNTSADRGGIGCRRKLREAISAAGGTLPDAPDSGEDAWGRLK